MLHQDDIDKEPCVNLQRLLYQVHHVECGPGHGSHDDGVGPIRRTAIHQAADIHAFVDDGEPRLLQVTQAPQGDGFWW